MKYPVTNLLLNALLSDQHQRYQAAWDHRLLFALAVIVYVMLSTTVGWGYAVLIIVVAIAMLTLITIALLLMLAVVAESIAYLFDALKNWLNGN